MSLCRLASERNCVRMRFAYMLLRFNLHTLSALICAALVSACASVPAQEPAETQPVPVMVYQNPLKAMMDGYYQPVEIELKPAWNLTEKQMATATQPPEKTSGGARGYVYPEDKQPTAEQVADGSALTPTQRRHMKKARMYARRLAAWNSRIAAEKYNQENSAALAQVEKERLHLVIYLGKQRGVCKVGEKVIRNFKICSGKRSTPTPKGHFHVIEKHEKHKSNLYNNADMSYFMRLTVNGVGLHQGPVRSYPASHGCIRLMRDDAHFLFKHCAVGTAVFIEN